MLLVKRAVAEAAGTALLLTAIVGSGIMAERLSGGNIALALLANSIATGGALMCLIVAFGPISGAHLNPAVSISDLVRGGLTAIECFTYVVAQVFGAVLGVAVAHLMFGLPLFFASHHPRSGPAQWFAEFIATFGLLTVIWGCVRFKSPYTAFAVAGYIVAAYWFTASTSFANPAVTIARSLTNTFAGIRPPDVVPFIIAQLAGAFVATALFTWLAPVSLAEAKNVVIAHE